MRVCVEMTAVEVTNIMNRCLNINVGQSEFFAGRFRSALRSMSTPAVSPYRRLRETDFLFANHIHFNGLDYGM
jgi:hypothetical protein